MKLKCPKGFVLYERTKDAQSYQEIYNILKVAGMMGPLNEDEARKDTFVINKNHWMYVYTQTDEENNSLYIVRGMEKKFDHIFFEGLL